MCAELWVEQKRKARKQHQCQECLGAIVPGQNYIYASGFQDGRPFSYKAHKSCLSALQDMIAGADDCWSEGALEHTEGYESIMATPEHLR